MVTEISDSLSSLTEIVHFTSPHFGFIDVDKTLMYEGQNPKDFPEVVSLMTKLATPAHNLYLTFNTQHLADAPKYEDVWKLKWQLPNGSRIFPPVPLEMGLVIGRYDEKKQTVNYEFGQHHLIDIKDYSENTRPKIIELIKKTFPGLITFESGLVLIGAQILLKAKQVYGENPKSEMKPILEEALFKKGLKAFVISAGSDLDVAPPKIQMGGKRIGFVTLYKQLQKEFPGFNFSLEKFLQTFYFADDKTYAGKGLLEPLAILGAGSMIPLNADSELKNIPGSIQVAKQGPLYILEAILNHAVNIH